MTEKKTSKDKLADEMRLELEKFIQADHISEKQKIQILRQITEDHKKKVRK